MKIKPPSVTNQFFATLCLAALIISGAQADESAWNKTAQAGATPIAITVYKSPTCGCCGDWVKHLEQHGFVAKTVNLSDLSSIKTQLGVPRALQSCHTAVVDDYVIEGHVPAADIRLLVKQKSDYRGISVPQMPVGSPGMEMGSRKDPFKVVAFHKDGSTEVVKQYQDY